jgi:hypothetical protein
MSCHAMHPMQDLFLECLSYARQIDMQPICTPMLAKFYSYKKWVLQAHVEPNAPKEEDGFEDDSDKEEDGTPQVGGQQQQVNNMLVEF